MVKARAKHDHHMSMHGAWFGVYFDRQRRLKPLPHYMRAVEARSKGARAPDEIMGNLTRILGVKRGKSAVVELRPKRAQTESTDG